MEEDQAWKHKYMCESHAGVQASRLPSGDKPLRGLMVALLAALRARGPTAGATALLLLHVCETQAAADAGLAQAALRSTGLRRKG
jgi:hypothetical protein